MFFLLLPFMFNPIGLASKWLPTIYLATWPIIIHTLGRGPLLTHAIVTIIFILACDVTRELMLKIVGFDLISLPAGIGVLAALMTERGFSFLSALTPVFNSLVTVSEPVFLILESFIVLHFIRTVNRWMSDISNRRQQDSDDLSAWEPPLTTGAFFARILVVLIAIAGYIFTYEIIHQSKTLLSITDNEAELNHFNNAIAMLVTLQIISFFATLYKDEGIVSESSMVVLAASIPIFIASWYYNSLKGSTSW